MLGSASAARGSRSSSVRLGHERRASSPTCSPSGARSSSACARPGSSRSRTRSSRAAPRSARSAHAHDDLDAGRGDRGPLPGRRARITARRGHGKAAFLDLRDRSGQIQLHSRADVLGRGRARGAGGARPRRHRRRRGDARSRPRRASSRCGSRTGRCSRRALRPLPDKYHGLEDVETRYRRRELDLIANPEARELFELRARVIAAVRAWLDERGFLEVETPVLQPLYGGALARPFTTHHNALDRDLYLRIATELYLKRLHRRRDRPRLRARQGLPQRGDLAQAQPRVHDARVVRGVRRLRRRRGAPRAAGRVRRRAGAGDDEDRARREARSTSPPPWRRVTLRDAIRERTGIDLAARPSREELAAAIGLRAGFRRRAGASSSTGCSRSSSSRS